MTVGMAAALGLGVSSCDLEMLPLNDVVLENFWTEKADVDGVLNSCYLGLQQNNVILRMATWGELRSDNIVEGANVTSDIKELLKGNLLYTNSACDWGGLYTVINRCNTVLEYAPGVAEKDPNFTHSDLLVTQAEAKTLRALCYFYLARTYNKVPFSYAASVDDNQSYVYPASPCENILDSLIADLDECKDNAVRKYSESKKNSGKITRVAIYSLLADMCLWRASDANLDKAKQQEYYKRCVDYCDYVIDYKIKQYDDNEEGNLTNQIDADVYREYGYPLIAEKVVGNDGAPNAFNKIFCDGNSFESIFEITFEKSSSASVRNYSLASLYGGYSSSDATSATTYVAAAQALMDAAAIKTTQSYDQNTLFTYYDYRGVESFQCTESSNSNYPILKYSVGDFSSSSFGKVGSSWQAVQTKTVHSAMNTSNWIIYRLSDVMLMRAEAEVQIAGYLSENATETDTTSNAASRAYVDGSTLSTAEALYDDAFNIVSAVFMRSNPDAWNSETARPVRADFKDKYSFENLVENERRREFLFEGKRYYDLVRRSRREGNTTYFSNVISAKFQDGSGGNALKIKMAMMDFMYMPYSKSQLDLNPYLTQNPAYAKDDDISKN